MSKPVKRCRSPLPDLKLIAQRSQSTTVQFRRYGYSSSYLDIRNKRSERLTSAKLTAVLLSAYIREQPGYEQNLKSKQHLAKWVKDFKKLVPSAFNADEIAVPDSDDDSSSDESDNDEEIIGDIEKTTIKYVVDELKYYLTLSDGPIEVGPVEGTWQSDSLIQPTLRDELIQNVSKLENSIPASSKYWNDPNRTVWNVLHPSMYCLVKGSTRILEVPHRLYPFDYDKSRSNLLVRHPAGAFLSLREGNEIAFPYEPTPSKCGYSPSAKYQWLPSEFFIQKDGAVQIDSYINNLHPEEHSGLYSVIEEVFEEFTPMFAKVLGEFKGRRYLSNHSRRKTMGNAGVFQWPTEKFSEYKMAGRTVQVITKFTNYELTPENPEFPGGDFHSEGMSNEKIIASGIYYYHSENITESRLELQHETTYAKDPIQSLGSFLTKEGRCIAFSNKLEHRIAPFKLVDPTRNGYRKILIFFLINPGHEILSTAHVPPQQRSWFVGKANRFTMNPREALEHREGIKAERKRMGNDLTGTRSERAKVANDPVLREQERQREIRERARKEKRYRLLCIRRYTGD